MSGRESLSLDRSAPPDDAEASATVTTQDTGMVYGMWPRLLGSEAEVSTAAREIFLPPEQEMRSGRPWRSPAPHRLSACGQGDSSGRSGFTLLELLVVATILALLACLLLPALSRTRAKGQRLACGNNQKQLVLALAMFADENDGRYPWWLDPPDGTKGYTWTWQHFYLLSNEIVTPKVLHCPSDSERSIAQNFGDGPDGLAHPQNQNKAVSFAIGTEARVCEPRLHLVTDRNAVGETDRSNCGVAGITDFITIFGHREVGLVRAEWDGTIHRSAGNMGLVDGSVQQLSSRALFEHMEQTGDTNFSNCILKPR